MKWSNRWHIRIKKRHFNSIPNYACIVCIIYIICIVDKYSANWSWLFGETWDPLLHCSSARVLQAHVFIFYYWTPSTAIIIKERIFCLNSLIIKCWRPPPPFPPNSNPWPSMSNKRNEWKGIMLFISDCQIEQRVSWKCSVCTFQVSTGQLHSSWHQASFAHPYSDWSPPPPLPSIEPFPLGL